MTLPQKHLEEVDSEGQLGDGHDPIRVYRGPCHYTNASFYPQWQQRSPTSIEEE